MSPRTNEIIPIDSPATPEPRQKQDVEEVENESKTNNTGTSTSIMRDGNEERDGLLSTLSSPTNILPIMVMIDMFSVALVVPLLHQYYRNAGVTSASQREMLSSLFSSSQIVGGLAIGALSDAGLLSQRHTLCLSFLGSAISYSLIAKGGIHGLIFSRILVGLVKQTMTVTTSMLVQYTTNEDRARYMGRLSAGSTIAFVIGPSTGALLYKHVHESAPALFASGLFILNLVLATTLLPKEKAKYPPSTEMKRVIKSATSSTNSNKEWSKFSSFTSNLKSCFSSKELGCVVSSILIFHWVTRATSYGSMASYYEEMYGIEPHQRGYLSSYQKILSLLFQSFLVQPLLMATGGEHNASCLSAATLTLATFMELSSSLGMFLIVISPMISISSAMLHLSLKSLVTQVAPKQSLGSILAALDVLQNVASVSVPFYRTFLFGFLGRYFASAFDENASMTGDPSPQLWLLSSGFHWFVASILLTSLLLGPSYRKGYRPEKDDNGDISDKKIK